MAEKSVASSQIEKIYFSLEQFLFFLRNEIKLKQIDARFGKELETKGAALLHSLEMGKSDEAKASSTLQGLIDTLNARLIGLPQAHLFPLFPQELPINQVQNHIIAFELFLNQKLLLNEIPLSKQAPLFTKAVNLWRDVGVRRTLKEAMVELSNFTATLNSMLSESEAYPLSNPDLY